MTLDANIKIIEDAKTSIRNAIEAKGISVPLEDHIETYASKVDQIEGTMPGSLDLSGTGWETELSFPLYVQRLGTLNEDISYTKKIYSEWNPEGKKLGENDIRPILANSDKKLVYFPKVDTSKITNMNGAFYSDSNLFALPDLDFSNLKNDGAASMFEYCRSLTDVRISFTSHFTWAYGIFRECENLKSVYPSYGNRYILSYVVNFSEMFYNDINLESLGLFNGNFLNDNYGSQGRALLRTFTKCYKLKNFEGIENCTCSYDLGDSPLLTYQSLENVVNGLYDYGKGDNGKTITFNTVINYTYNMDPLEEKARMKGWTILYADKAED